MQGDEFLRGVLSQNCRVARQKVYTIEVPMGNTPGVGKSVSVQQQFNKGALFLLTSISTQWAEHTEDMGSLRATSAGDEYLFQAFLNSNGKKLFQSPVVGIITNSSLNREIDGESYVLMTENEVLTVTFTTTQVAAGVDGTVFCYACLYGIEYIE